LYGAGGAGSGGDSNAFGRGGQGIIMIVYWHY
jgi:hypothetical protein